MTTTTETGKMPKPGEAQEIHINGDEVRNIGTKPVRQFVTEWDSTLDSQVDPRKAYLGIIHSSGAYLVELRASVTGGAS